MRPELALENLRGDARPPGWRPPEASEVRDYIRTESSTVGIERMEAFFGGQAFSPHRHDTYAIGVTVAGIQTFRYRGAQRYCRPRQCHILYPDETHDGSAATEAGFGYRIAYVDPLLVQQALGGRPLPFVRDPIVDLTEDQWAHLWPLWDLNEDIDELGRIDIEVALADTLAMPPETRAERVKPLPLQTLARVRHFIAAAPETRRSASELERVADLDRWSLARQFRAAFGTSPSRFRTMRQLDEVRRLLKGGTSCADAALAAGFADQSHMSRKFKRAYGLTPARWAVAATASYRWYPSTR